MPFQGIWGILGWRVVIWEFGEWVSGVGGAGDEEENVVVACFCLPISFVAFRSFSTVPRVFESP